MLKTDAICPFSCRNTNQTRLLRSGALTAEGARPTISSQDSTPGLARFISQVLQRIPESFAGGSQSLSFSPREKVAKGRMRIPGLGLKQETPHPTLRGGFEYFKHSHKWTFLPLDKWIRMRLRSLLRKRPGLKGRGRGRGADHQRRPNFFFADQALYSLNQAHESASQSSSRQNHRLESRLREIRLPGSEGGGAELNRRFLPLSKRPPLRSPSNGDRV